MSLRTTLFPIILLICSYGIAQVTDDFSDGDFSSDPVWSGNTSLWQITSEQLNSNNSGANTYYLSTTSAFNEITEWDFYVNLKFSTSGSNYVDVFLISDNTDLTSAQNGYFIRIGDTQDEIVLYKLIAGVETALIDNAEGVINSSSNNPFGIKVVRDGLDNWTLSYDDGYTGSFVEAGSAIDNSYISGISFGFLVVQSTASGPIGNHFFDDIAINGLDIDSVFVNSATEIVVDFSMVLSQSEIETVGNYSISGITINSATQNLSDASKVTLTLDDSSPLTTATHNLIVSSTLTGNNEISYSFDYEQLELDDLLTLSETEIQLDFNVELDQTSAETITNYSVDNGIGQPSSAVIDSEDHSKVNLTLSTSLFESTTFQLTVSGVENESGNSTFSGSQDFTFVIPLIIDTLYATSISSCRVEFNKSLNESIAETVGNYSLDVGVSTPTSALLQPDGKSVELAFSSNFADATYILTVNSLEDLDGNEIASNSSDSFDYLTLDIASLEQEGDLSIKIIFNQDVDESTAEILSNYNLSEIGQPITASQSDTNLDEVILTWGQLYNSSYDLTVSDVSNSNSNSSPSSLTQSISISKATSEGHLIINEFLADPTPSVGLPEVEFVEVYNKTDYSIELGSFTLDGQIIGSYHLPGKGYVVLTDNSDVSSFSTSNIVGISSMGALTNTSDAIVLKDQFGNLIDSINYVASEWFNDDSKNSGGYSLERVDPLQPCSDENNWSGSNDESGGTPGEENSVFDDVDNTSPLIESLEVVGGDSLSITFSESINESTIMTGSFDLDGFAFNTLIRTSFSEYYLVLSSDLTSEVTHNLIIENISDCRGNELTSQTYNFYYDVKPPVLDRIDLLSETELILVFDEPILESPAENESNYTIDGIDLDRATLQDSATNKVLLEFDEAFTLETSYTLNYSNLQDTLKNQSVNQTSDFTFSSDIDTIWVETANVLVLNYTEEPSISATNVYNYYIESGGLRPDTIIYKEEIGGFEYRLSFNENFDENKELKLYITNVFGTDNETRLATPAKSFTYDTRSPSINEVLVENDSQLVVVFNESVESSSALKSANYLLDGTNQPESVDFTSSSSIQLTFKTKFVGDHTIAIQRIRDLSGNEMSSTRRIDFTYDINPPVVLDAYQISPGQIQIVFDEQLERNSAISISNYMVASSTPDLAEILGPDSMVVNLTFTTLSEDSNLKVDVKNVKDLYDNSSDTQELTINTLMPRLSSLNASTKQSVLVKYSQDVSDAEELTNYSLEGFSLETITALDEQSYELVINETFKEGDTLILTVNNVVGTNEQILQQNVINSRFEAGIEDFGMVNDRVVFIDFKYDLKQLSSANFEVIDETISFVSQDSDDRSLVRLTLSNEVDSGAVAEVKWNSLVDVYDRVIPDYEIEIFNDKTSPEFDRYESDFYGKIHVTFSEVMDQSSLLSVNKYAIEGIGNPIFTSLLNDSTVTLDFDNQLIRNEDYSLTIYPLSDQSGNHSIEETITLTYEPPALPEFFDIIITEMMVDPSPSVGLPEVEYVELFNNSTNTFNIRGLILEDESGEAQLPDYLLEPSEYVLLVDVGDASHFDIKNILELSDFPSLSNSGEHLILKTLFGDLINTVTYASNWYGDSNKDDGGYSLEIIDPNGGCIDSQNWRASTNEDGGTPGFQNSVYRNGADGIAPEINQFVKNSTSEFTIYFTEAMDSLSLINSTFSVPGYPVNEVTVFGDLNEILNVRLSEELPLGAYYTVSFSGAEDCSGTTLLDTTFVIGFGKDPLPGDLIITEIMADPDPQVGLPGVEYVEIFNNTDSPVTLENVRFRDDNSSRLIGDVVLEDSAYAVLIHIDAIEMFEELGVEFVIGLEDWPSLTNSGERISLAADVIIDEVLYDDDWFLDPEKKSGGYSLEIIDPNGGCMDSQNWRASTNEDGGTPGFQNSVYREGADGIAPEINRFVKNSTSEFTIYFTEAMDSLSLINSTFSIPGYPVNEVTVSGDLYEILNVRLNEELPLGAFYTVSFSEAEDCSGTTLSDTTFVIGFGKDPLPGDLIITEIMADPDPQIGLPSVEYVEIFNNTDSPVTLENVRFRDDNSSRLIGDVVLEDSAYAVLIPIDAIEMFEEFGVEYVIGLEDWPSLTNSGEHISLATDVIIDEVVYDDDWFLDPEKKSGGYSLEIIDPNGECPGASNWGGSVDESGGTPGRQNSIFNDGPDDIKPVVTSFEVIDSRTLRFTFNEVMDSLSLLSANIAGVTVVNRTVTGVDHQVLTVGLIVPLAEDEVIEILISEATDCSGNSMNASTFEVAIGVAPEFNELIVTEIMSDPDPSVELPNSEYLELYNRSTKLLSLDGVALIDETDTVDLPAVTIRPGHYLLICPTSRVADFGSSIDVTGVTGWSSLSNSGESLTLISEGELIFQIMYDPDWHVEDALEGGISLEMKDFNNPCGQEENWTSSTASAGGTPGFENASSEGVPDNFGPSLLSARALNEGTIELIFDEVLGANSPNNTVLVFEPSLAVQTVLFANDRQSLYVFLQDELVKNQPVTVEVYGTIDCLGNSVKTNSSEIVLSDEGTTGDVILNEILFNPKSEGVDFLEIQNISSKYIDLFGWKIGRRLDDGSIDYETLNSHFITEPEMVLAITTDTIITKNQYPKGIKELLQTSSLPTMPNAEGTVVISNSNDVIVDEFTYNEDYHLSFLENVDGVSLERIDAHHETQDPDNWTSASSAVGYATPGYTNSQSYKIPVATAVVSIEPKVFVPGNRSQAHQSFTTINYQLDQSGQFANITVYNQMGQPIADLGKGISLGSSGFVRWDGTSFDGSVVRRGYYVVLFELYDGSGNSQTLRETVVVGK